MEVEYDLTRDDLYAFQWRAAFTSPRGRRARRTVYLLWLLALVLIAIVPAIGPDGFVISRVSFTFLIVAIPIVFLAQWLLETRLMRRTILGLVAEEKPGRGQLGKHRLVVSEDGLKESTAVGESRTSWAGVDRIEQDQDYIFIYTSAAAAHMIPKRAFSGKEEAEAFYQLARAGKAAAP
jgi:YcxB-like protein